jgi:hypothetical protein
MDGESTSALSRIETQLAEVLRRQAQETQTDMASQQQLLDILGQTNGYLNAAADAALQNTASAFPAPEPPPADTSGTSTTEPGSVPNPDAAPGQEVPADDGTGGTPV